MSRPERSFEDFSLDGPICKRIALAATALAKLAFYPTMSKLDDDIDDLFRLPLPEFTGARNVLAATLKKNGRQNEADRVKLLTKPSISAWTVNQLYWVHRDAFDQLIATGKRFRHGQTSRPARKAMDMRESLDARREALTHLSDLATALLHDAGHNPTLDTMRRITTTLEALSAYALLPDGPTPGRLTQDVDPPSFELLASLMSGAVTQEATKEPATPTTRQKPPKDANARRLEEKTRQARIAAAKASLQQAKRLLADARSKTQSLEAAQKKLNADAKEAEKDRRETEERLKRATAASEDATRRAKSAAAELEGATTALEEAKRVAEEATKELESLLREPPASSG